MSDLRELVGDDLPERELAALARADDALRATPAPPQPSESLTGRILAIPGNGRAGGRRRFFAGLALAAALAAATFGIGVWVGGDEGGGRESVEQVTLTATADAPPGAEMVLDVLPVDDAGNWAMAAEVSGLEPLPEGGYYEVWLTKGEELVMSCGRFVVGADGSASNVWLNAPYDFDGFDRWVVVSMQPGEGPSDWLLDGPVVS